MLEEFLDTLLEEFSNDSLDEFTEEYQSVCKRIPGIALKDFFEQFLL